MCLYQEEYHPRGGDNGNSLQTVGLREKVGKELLVHVGYAIP